MKSAAEPLQVDPPEALRLGAAAFFLAEHLSNKGKGSVRDAHRALKTPADRYQANGVIAGMLGEGTITTLDGETFGAELAPVLRKWVEKNPEAAAAPSRWIVYPRTVVGGLAFFVVGQRQALPGETEAQLNRQVDRFQVVGVLTNSRGLRKQTCIRICRNKLVPKGKKRHPSWRPRFLFLAGLPPAPTKAWWNTDVKVQCQRVGRALKILAIDKVGQGAMTRTIEIGPAQLPWPWKPSSQAIWRLCQREALSTIPPWPCTDAEAGEIIQRFLAVQRVVLTEIYPVVGNRQAGRVDPVGRKYAENLGRYQDDLTRQWLANTDQFLAGLSDSDRDGLAGAHQLKQRLATAMIADVEADVADNWIEVEGDRFWCDGWPIRGKAARILRENLPLAGGANLGGIEAQEAPPVNDRKTKMRSSAAKADPEIEAYLAGPKEWAKEVGAETLNRIKKNAAFMKSRKLKKMDPDKVIEALHKEAEENGWTDPLLHLKITKALDEAI